MATKATTRKKTTTSRKKSSAKATKLPVGVIYETNPDAHIATGKYKFFYGFFALTTIFFAAVSVWLFIFSSDIMNKLESIEACSRDRTCTIRSTKSDDTATEENGTTEVIVEPIEEDVVTE